MEMIYRRENSFLRRCLYLAAEALKAATGSDEEPQAIAQVWIDQVDAERDEKHSKADAGEQ